MSRERGVVGESSLVNLRCLILVLLLALAGQAQVPELPDPILLGQSDSIAIFVARARAEDTGFRKMLATGIAGVQGSDSGSLAAMLSGFLSLRSQEQMIVSALPLQWVRVDRMGADGKLVSNVAITLKGWRGFQSLLYNHLTDGPDGKPFETRSYGGEDIVLRTGWEKPSTRMVLARVQGTFLNCATPDDARYLIDRLGGQDQHELSGTLWQAYAGMPHDQDAYGAIVNRDGALLKVMFWINAAVTAEVRNSVGRERMDRVAALVRTVTWQADVVSDDRIDIQARFTTDGRAQTEEVAALVEDVREVLEAGGRMGEFYLTTQPDGLKAGFSMIGFRDTVSRYLSTVRI